MARTSARTSSRSVRPDSVTVLVGLHLVGLHLVVAEIRPHPGANGIHVVGYAHAVTTLPEIEVGFAVVEFMAVALKRQSAPGMLG
jgi:hypothetical protein